MGYYTDYRLDVCTATKFGDSFTTANCISPLIETQLEDEIEKLDVFEGGDCDSGWYGNAKWYDWEEDMLLLSKRFPEIMFTLGGIGEEFGDIWEAYFYDGRVDFFIGDKPFTGIIDCVAKDGDSIIILDNKSRALKPRSGRKKPTKSDLELDEYLRQLYLYSIPIQTEFQQYPERLEFNCFRMQQIISEPFREDALEHAKLWALQTIDTITQNEDWSPKMEYWKCKYLCDHSHQCEYQLMNRG